MTGNVVLYGRVSTERQTKEASVSIGQQFTEMQGLCGSGRVYRLRELQSNPAATEGEKREPVW